MDPILFETGARKRGRPLPKAGALEQSDLFGASPAPGPQRATPATRSTDPATSHAAAESAGKRLTDKQHAVLACLDLCGRATDEELIREYRTLRAQVGLPYLRGAGWPDLTDSSIRTRRKELQTLGYVGACGEKLSTRGNKSTLWRVLPGVRV